MWSVTPKMKTQVAQDDRPDEYQKWINVNCHTKNENSSTKRRRWQKNLPLEGLNDLKYPEAEYR